MKSSECFCYSVKLTTSALIMVKKMTNVVAKYVMIVLITKEFLQRCILGKLSTTPLRKALLWQTDIPFHLPSDLLNDKPHAKFPLKNVSKFDDNRLPNVFALGSFLYEANSYLVIKIIKWIYSTTECHNC